MNTTRTPRSAWDNSRHWPMAHRSQHDAGLPDGPIADDTPITRWQRFCFGALIGLLITGPALVDFWSTR
jgi:hypothetical protein